MPFIMAFIRRIMVRKGLRITLTASILLFTIVLISSTSLWYIEKDQDLPFIDCVWFSFVTMTTTGYGDITPKTVAGKLFTIIIPMSMGIGAMGYFATILATGLIERKIRFMNGELALTCENHILIVNLQREAKIHTLLDELRKDNKSSDIPIVLIDNDIEECPASLLKRKNFFFIHGNPLWRVTMERANALKATQAVILAKDPNHSASDGVTLQIAMVLKYMHKEVGTTIDLVAEVVSDDSVEPLQLAGIKHIVCLESLVAPMLAQKLKE
jgi:voltage-gated potassium channel